MGGIDVGVEPEVETVGDRLEYVGVRIWVGDEEAILGRVGAIDFAETMMLYAKKVGEEAPKRDPASPRGGNGATSGEPPSKRISYVARKPAQG